MRSRQAASSRATARSRGSIPPERGSRRHTSSGSRSSLDVGDHAALLARPLQPPAGAQALLDLVGQRQQVLDVLARVGELLLRQRPRVPAREARGLGDADLEHVVQQPGVAGLGREAREAGGDLGVEHVGHVGPPLAAEDRHVLPAGVEHDLHALVGEHLGQRRGIEARQRVEHDDLAADDDLHEAQQRLVAAFRHELGIDPEAALAPRPVGHPLDVVHRPGEGNCDRMTASHARSGSSARCPISTLADGVTGSGRAGAWR